MTKTCLGCGVKLQSTDEFKLGYIPPNSLNKDYCMRCYKLTHYNDFTNAYHQVNSKNTLKKLINKDGLGIFILDFVNLNQEAINYYHCIKMPKILVINKSDIIPKNIDYYKIKCWLKKEFKIEEDIIFSSAHKNRGISKLNKIIEESNKPIYFLGMTNVGKSSLLNKLFNLNKPLTTSILPNTTLDFIRLKTDKEIYDTEGFTYQSKLPNNLLKQIMIKDEIHPINMPLKANAGILIKDIGRIITNTNNSITCFFSKNETIKKVYSNENIYLEQKPIIIDVLKESNVIIKGIGFCYVKNACTLTIYNIPLDLIEVEPSFLRSEYNG